MGWASGILISRNMFVEINRITADFPIGELDNDSWDKASDVVILSYWSGDEAPHARHAAARLLWSPAALFVRFVAMQHEPLIVSEIPDTGRKMHGLWDRDVCEIYIAPNRAEPNRYFEFEAAPNGEWIDLALEITPDGRVTDWDYDSGMECAARVEDGRVVTAIRIPFRSLGGAPKAGDVWLGNLFRCVGSGPDRGYLAWRPTRTEKPSFHVPAAFGEFRFL